MTFYHRIARSPILLSGWAGLAGAAWGLGLARALAETFPNSPTFEWLPTVLMAAAMAGAIWYWRGRRANPAPLCFRDCRDDGQKTDFGFVSLFLPALYVFWPEVAPRVGWTLLGGSLALTFLLVVRERVTLRQAQDDGRILSLFLTCVTLALYLRTLGPTVGQADTFEFQVVAPTLGVAHPTGYPLYILLGKLFSWLPFGSVAWRVNLTAAVFATAATLLLFLLIRRLTRRPLVASIAALAFAFSRVFWSQAVVAEVYALHNFFVAAVMLLLVRFFNDPNERSAVVGPSSIYLLAFLLGLSFANHLTTALLLPAVGLTLLLLRPWIGWRGWLIAAGLFALGLSLYLYIYFRWPALHDGVWMSPGEFWRYITGQQFGGALRLDAWRSDSTRYEIVGRLLREPFGWPGLLLGGLGLIWLALKKWRVAFITLVTFGAYAWYALSYYVPDVSVFILPAHLVLAIWIGAGMTALLDFLLGPPKSVLLISLYALLPLSLLWTNLPQVDQSDQRAAHAWGDRVLDLPLASDAAILADSVRIAPLYYLQHIEGRRPDLDMLVLADEALYRAELETRMAAGQTVYLARFLPGLEGRYHLRSLGPLTEVGTRPLTEAPPLDRVLGEPLGLPEREAVVELLGLTGPAPGPDGGTGLTLYWRAGAPVNEVYHVRLRLVDGEGQVWWRTEAGRHAVDNYYPTLAWRLGEVVIDYHEIPPLVADPTLPAGSYTLQVGLFRPFSDEGLVTADGEAWVSLLPFDPSEPVDMSPSTHLLRARFAGDEREDGLTLVGADIPDVVAADAAVELTLHWRADHAAGLVRPTLTWVGRRGDCAPAQILEQLGSARLSLLAPAAPGDYVLRLGLVGGDGLPFPARCGWLARSGGGCALATVRVTEATASALADFDGKVALVNAELGASTLQPGALLPVTLRWQGRRPMEDDYTVSVQLVGADGQLYGQVDAWPVQGTLPTSQWTPGQHIADPYQVQLRPDAPPGRYRVAVVVYLLATNTRLPLVDASGRVIGDIAWVGEVMVGSDE